MTEEPTLIERLLNEAAELDDDLDETVILLREAAKELKDWERSFGLYWRANQRATELYNAAHPGGEGTLPDQGKMIGWLCDELERKRREV